MVGRGTVNWLLLQIWCMIFLSLHHHFYIKEVDSISCACESENNAEGN